MNENLKILIKVLVYPILYLFLGLSYLMPRNKNIWLFGSCYSVLFNDNAKYLYLYVNENCPDVKAIWISSNKNTIRFLRSKNLKAYNKYSVKGIFYALTGKFYFFNGFVGGINTWANGGAVKVHLWHGVPIKKIRFDMQQFAPSFTNRFLYPGLYPDKNDYVLSTSKKITEIFISAFRVDKNKYLELGYPRNEILSYSEDRIMNFIEKYESIETKELVQNLKKYDKVFVYMPTWRDNGRDFIKESNIDFQLLNKTLQEKNYFLILKLHNLTKLSVNIHEYGNILRIDNKLDMYPILPFTDCLITDYSSIFFDYKLMNKEVILFPFDKEEYISKDREMYYDYSLVEENQLVANSFGELVELLKSDVKNTESNKLLREMILETKDVESCRKVVDVIMNICNE